MAERLERKPMLSTIGHEHLRICNETIYSVILFAVRKKYLP